MGVHSSNHTKAKTTKRMPFKFYISIMSHYSPSSATRGEYISCHCSATFNFKHHPVRVPRRIPNTTGRFTNVHDCFPDRIDCHALLDVGGRPFNSWRCGGWFEKKFPASACRKKKIACSTNVIESLWKKKGKNILPTRLLEKNSWWPEITHPLPQELDGRPLICRHSLFSFRNTWA